MIVFDVPSPPIDIEFVNVCANSLTLIWKPPVFNGSAQINNYIVQKREKEEEQWTVVANSVVRNSFKVMSWLELLLLI